MNDDEDEEPFTPVATLDRNGKISGLIVPKDQRKPAKAWAEEPALELEEQAPKRAAEARPEEEHVEPLPFSPNNTRRIVIAALVVLVLGGAAAIVFLTTRTRSPLMAAVEEPEVTHPLVIESEPAGASVFIDGEEMGKTPLLGTNEVARGKRAELRLHLDGYQIYVGEIVGGRAAKVQVKLHR